MKTISTPLIITSFRSKVDGSLGISASTPELSTEEKAKFFELQNQNLEALLKPVDMPAEDIKKIKGEFETRSPAQRLYNVLFVYWKQKGGKGLFRSFYEKWMDKKINEVKDCLN